MALVALASAKGSPGVTTAATVLAALWPRSVLLAECDPAGSDLVVRMTAPGGGALTAERGLVSLAAAGRKGLDDDVIMAHTHQPALVDVGAGRQYLNPGAWFDGFRYAIATERGAELRQFKP